MKETTCISRNSGRGNPSETARYSTSFSGISATSTIIMMQTTKFWRNSEKSTNTHWFTQKTHSMFLIQSYIFHTFCTRMVAGIRNTEETRRARSAACGCRKCSNTHVWHKQFSLALKQLKKSGNILFNFMQGSVAIFKLSTVNWPVIIIINYICSSFN